MMYDNVYRVTVDCGIAQYLDDEEVNAVLEHLEYFLYADECGINTNQQEGAIETSDELSDLSKPMKLLWKYVVQVMSEQWLSATLQQQVILSCVLLCSKVNLKSFHSLLVKDLIILQNMVVTV
jgi:hypothetical protein